MGQMVPRDRPLSDQDREYLLSRNDIATIERIDAMHGTERSEEDGGDGEVLPYEQWTVEDLRAEIDDRNKEREVKISKGGSRADMAARLREDDAAQAA